MFGIGKPTSHSPEPAPLMMRPPMSLFECVMRYLKETEQVEFATKFTCEFGEFRNAVVKSHLLKCGALWLKYEIRDYNTRPVEIGILDETPAAEVPKHKTDTAAYHIAFRQITAFSRDESEKIRDAIALAILKIGTYAELKLEQ